MTTKKILCPIDFSPGARHAMCVAVQLASAIDAEIVLFHAWYIPSVAFSTEGIFPSDALAEMRGHARDQLAAAERDAIALGARRLETRFVEGQPWQAIIAALEDASVDLVVIGTHGRTGLARVLLGSVAEKIVRHAPCSVLTVGPSAQVAPFVRALCPVDFSEQTAYALHLAADIVRPAGASASLSLLHAIEAPGPLTGEPVRTEFLGALDQAGRAALEAWAVQIKPELPGRVTTQIRIGYPGAQTLAALDDDPQIDVVVMASHGRTGVARILLGSVAEKLVRHARCPVLVARKRG
ncbi:MAG: universal stress protein [Kofleriaceae bacterium]